MKIKKVKWGYCASALSVLMASTAHSATLAPSVSESGNVTGSIAENLSVKNPQACVGLEANADRLTCYDTYFGRVAPSVAAAAVEKASATAAKPEENSKSMSTTESLTNAISNIKTSDLVGAAPKFDPGVSMLDRRWELSDDAKLGTFNIRAYKPVYILPAIYTTRTNKWPTSPNPENQVTTPLNLDHTEAKFQLSLKTKAVEGLFGDNGDLWLGYTQSSRWQVYNSDASRPFRETNYEPEATLMFTTNYNILGLNGRLLGVSLNHQSNGRSLPLSRSWNRAILNIGLERDNFALMLRPWYRIPEQAKDDDNRDIQDYMGRGDLLAYYKRDANEFSLMLRHSLRGGDRSHGAAQFDWAFPIKGALRGYLQIFDGYGESMIDYNHRSTYVGLGVSMVNWF